MKKIIAIAALAAAVSTCAHAENSIDNTLTGTPPVANVTAHALNFNVNSTYTPLRFTDGAQTDATVLATSGDANRVITSTSFVPTADHQYVVSAVTATGANGTVGMTASFSYDTSKPTSPATKTTAHPADNTAINILLTQNSTDALSKGSTTASFTVTDYAS
ncbi:hypothetical protein AAFR86_03910 [Salmonella enterica subsp. diarizonae serovar 58:r:z53]